MQTLAFELEVVTPLVLSGADQATAELRPPSIKNLMRFWYRTAKGETSDTSTTSREFDLFGSTGNSAKFIPRISRRGLLKDNPNQITDNEYKKSFKPGVKYLAFPFRPTSESNYEPIRSGINPPHSFNFSLKFLPGVRLDDENTIVASLWLLLFLGGIGSRSRRGFGSLRVKKEFIHAPTGLQFYFEGQLQDFQTVFQENLSRALQTIGFSPSIKPAQEIKFTTFSSDNSRIYLWNEPFDYAGDALSKAGLLLQQFRSYKEKRNKDDYWSVRNFLDDEKNDPTQYKRASFGLPINISYPHSLNGRAATVEGGFENTEDYRKEKQENNEDHDRRASPLFIKALKINRERRNGYALLFLYFPGQLLPKGEKLKVKATNGHKKIKYCDPSDFSAVENFLAEQVDNKRIQRILF